MNDARMVAPVLQARTNHDDRLPPTRVDAPQG
jgi:hypothetical protein